jgi:hypothetical protein
MFEPSDTISAGAHELLYLALRCGVAELRRGDHIGRYVAILSTVPFVASNAIGVGITQHERTASVCVQLLVSDATALLQLSDPDHFNTFSTELGADMRRAVQCMCTLPSVASVGLAALIRTLRRMIEFK